MLQKNICDHNQESPTVKALMFSQWDKDNRDVRGNRGGEGNPEDFHSTAKVFLFRFKDAVVFSGFHYCTSIVSTLHIKNQHGV